MIFNQIQCKSLTSLCDVLPVISAVKSGRGGGAVKASELSQVSKNVLGNVA